MATARTGDASPSSAEAAPAEAIALVNMVIPPLSVSGSGRNLLRLEFTGDAANGGVERAGGQECVGCVGEDAAHQAAALDGHRGANLGSLGDRRDDVRAVDRDRAGGGQRQPAVVDLEHLDVEGHGAAGEPPGDPGVRAGDEAV